MITNTFTTLRHYIRTLFMVSLLITHVANATGTAGTSGINWDVWDDSVIRLIVSEDDYGDSPIATGTAFAINDQGDYITNHHVIAMALRGGKVAAVESLIPKRLHPARIVWASETHDLAMVHIEAWKKPALTLSNGDLLKKGQDVYSIGFPGAADRDNLTEFNVSTLKKGVLSAFKNFPLAEGGRDIKMLEHDAAVNSGNSGGPLADACGRVVGINEQKALGEIVDQGNQGVALNSAEGILFSINTVELMALLTAKHIDFRHDDGLCTDDTIAAITNANKNMTLTLMAAGVIALLSMMGFIVLYNRVKQANNGQFNTRVLSRMIRERTGNQAASGPMPSPPKQAPARQILYRLVPQRHDLGLPTLTLPTPGNYLLGRGQAADIQLVIPNQYVSGKHLLITVTPNHSVVVEDLGSTNHTHIAGVDIARGQTQTLQLGQTLRIGHDEVIYTLQRG